MIPTIVSCLFLMKKRRMMMEVFPKSVRKLWKAWELRALVLISLTVQIVLIFFGNRRKYIPKTWIRITVWSAYLLADSVTTISLGILSNDLGQIFDEVGSVDAKSELTAFWAPFFLLHLGGPDTISAYSLEDNELYLRHLFGLLVQTTVAIYIFLMAWKGTHLSILAIPMIVVGSIKYGEKTGTLWSASRNELRNSMLTPADPGPNYPNFMDEYSLKLSEGFHVDAEEMKEAQVELDITAPEANATAEDECIIKAYAIFQKFKRLFSDLILSFEDRETSQSLFLQMSDKDAFNVIGIELGFMYDLLYTKAAVVYTRWGFARRLITFSLTCLVLVAFSFTEMHKYSKVDLSITFLLLVVAIFLEIYAALVLVFSDESKRWLIKHKKNTITILQAINRLEPMFILPRWSKSMAQFSLLCFCLKENPGHKILRFINIHNRREKNRYISYKEVPDYLTECLFKHVKDKLDQFNQSKETQESDTNVKDLNSQRGSRILEKYKEQNPQIQDNLNWSIDEVEFDQSILIWHIATEICHYTDRKTDIPEEAMENFKVSKLMSRYMLYLLVMYPFMLPIGIGLIRFRDTCAEARNFFEERMSIFDIDKAYSKVERRIHACKMLLNVKTHVLPIKVKGDRSKSVLFDACRLAAALNGLSDKKRKWDMIRDIWLDMLTYAASQCGGSQHAHQLRRGGELLTHVWLLMAHFGMTQQFQISQGHARAKLIVK